MRQPHNEPVPEERVEVLSVRPQGALFNVLDFLLEVMGWPKLYGGKISTYCYCRGYFVTAQEKKCHPNTVSTQDITV